MTLHLKYSDYARPGDAYHVARATLSEAPAKDIHTHTFHEILLIESGQGLHRVNGQRRELYPGLALCIHARDTHSVSALPGQQLRVVNVAFPTRTWQTLRRRYFLPWPDFLAGPIERREYHLPDVTAGADDLLHGDRSGLKIERYLINFFYRLSAHVMPGDSPQLPDWLARACQQLRQQHAFAGGVPAFARLAGRCPEHLARQVRHYLGKTPTDLVNEARLAYAASELQSSNRAITDIALDCGIENLSHFYSLFRRHFGCTPRRFRFSHHQIVR